MFRKLDYKELKNHITKQDIEFESTTYEDNFIGLDGQSRGIDSINFALSMKRKGYNIFVCGEKGLGKTRTVTALTKEFAKNEKIPNDICYVYNFKDPKEPNLLLVPAKIGAKLKNDMDELTRLMKIQLDKLIVSDSFETKKNTILSDFKTTKEYILDYIKSEAKNNNFSVESTDQGIYFTPMINDEILSEEEFNKLDDDEKEIIQIKSTNIQEQSKEIMASLSILESKLKLDIKNFEYGEYWFLLNHHIGLLIKKYIDHTNIINYLKEVKEDILENMDLFFDEKEDDDESIANLLPWYNKKDNSDTFNRYKINVLVDNGKLEHSPVITGLDVTFSDLMGEVEYDNEFKSLNTDFMKIKPGLFHKANGGYLILNAQNVLVTSNSWETISNALLKEEVSIKPLNDYSTGMVISHLNPEAMKLDIKIILVGSYFYYDIINNYDDDFKNIFKIRADFEYSVNYNKNNIKSLLLLIKNIISEYDFFSIENNGIISILDYVQKLAGSQDKIIGNLDILEDLLHESIYWAKTLDKTIIDSDIIKMTIDKTRFRNSIYEDNLNELVYDNYIMINTKGSKIGEINGLVVIDTDDYAFGSPTKITATTFMGENDIINIENEANLSGNIHNKGMQILSGYLGHKYSQKFPAAFSAQIGFEQNYGYIDGDSASSAELYALLSSLAEVPISQEIAVTGSINQFGEIQSIGGVTEKIESFFFLCKERGFTGNQGVIIPYQNKKDLVLSDDVVNAVKNNDFSIYIIENIENGMEILTGYKMGIMNKKGDYSKDTINGKIMRKLKIYYDISSDDN